MDFNNIVSPPSVSGQSSPVFCHASFCAVAILSFSCSSLFSSHKWPCVRSVPRFSIMFCRLRFKVKYVAAFWCFFSS